MDKNTVDRASTYTSCFQAAKSTLSQAPNKTTQAVPATQNLNCSSTLSTATLVFNKDDMGTD